MFLCDSFPRTITCEKKELIFLINYGIDNLQVRTIHRSCIFRRHAQKKLFLYIVILVLLVFYMREQ